MIISVTKSFEKFEKAVEIKEDKHEAYSNWGNALSGLARMRQDEGLFQESFEKYKPSSFRHLLDGFREYKGKK